MDANLRVSKHHFECLADEIGDYLMSAVITHGFSDLRAILKAGKIKLSDDSLDTALRLPIGWRQLIRLFLDNEKLFQAAKLNTDTYRKVFECFDSNAVRDIKSGRGSIYVADQSSLDVFDDENRSSELVYGIGINRAQEAIRVTFKGTKTLNDWTVNLDHFLTTVPNPLHGKATMIPQLSYIGIHRGFYNYLMQPGRNTLVSKYETIIGHLRRLLDQNPGFEIQVTGHSLGGALGTLFAFNLACEEGFPTPIRVITFGSPRLGNIHFVRAFHELELQGRINHLRVVNHRDLVTTVPDRLSFFTFWMQDGIYRHVGTELKLYRNSRSPMITMPVVHFSQVRLFLEDCSISTAHTVSRIASCTYGCFKEDYLRWHHINEYVARLLQVSKMPELSLNLLHGLLVRELNTEIEWQPDHVPKWITETQRRTSTIPMTSKTFRRRRSSYPELLRSIREELAAVEITEESNQQRDMMTYPEEQALLQDLEPKKIS